MPVDHFPLQKQPFADVLKTKRKTPVPESLFEEFIGFQPATIFKKRPRHRCFLADFVRFLRIPLLRSHWSKCF